MFRVVQVPAGAAQTTEPLGTKYKFWFTDPDYGLTLFKEGRPGTGENWAEKIACELAEMLCLPHAKYDFAEYEERRGVTSLSLVDKNCRIIHGNELLAGLETSYDAGDGQRYRNPRHTLRRVFAYFKASSQLVGAPYGWLQTERVKTPLDFFIGYLMLDAWIANQDRHDENWGILRLNDGNMFLAPSYDHGSSMARNEPDERRKLRLTTRDRGQHITTFLGKAKSGFFPVSADPAPKALYTLDAFVQAAAFGMKAAGEWMERLDAITRHRLVGIIDQVPADWMSEVAREFTLELLVFNRERILNAGLK